MQCSGHGTCAFFYALSLTPLAGGRSCANSDASCVALCVCDAGYTYPLSPAPSIPPISLSLIAPAHHACRFNGTVCRFAQQDLENKQRVRAKILSQMLAATANDDPRPAALELRLSALTSITAVMDEISVESSALIFELIQSSLALLLEAHEDAGMPESIVDGLLGTFDRSLSAAVSSGSGGIVASLVASTASYDRRGLMSAEGHASVTDIITSSAVLKMRDAVVGQQLPLTLSLTATSSVVAAFDEYTPVDARTSALRGSSALERFLIEQVTLAITNRNRPTCDPNPGRQRVGRRALFTLSFPPSNLLQPIPPLSSTYPHMPPRHQGERATLHALAVPASSDVAGTVKHSLTSVTAQAYNDVSDFVSTPAVLVSQFDASLCSSEPGTTTLTICVLPLYRLSLLSDIYYSSALDLTKYPFAPLYAQLIQHLERQDTRQCWWTWWCSIRCRWTSLLSTLDTRRRRYIEHTHLLCR